VFPDISTISKTCPICWDTFTATGRNARKHTYCTDRCRKIAFERRQRTEPTTAIAAPATATPVDQLPQPAANRACPHCGGPVTIVALLTTPEAARPQMPIIEPNGVTPLRR
jgi:endogenous inhibitor of DNA gyrase (YacG/DUF329 family)